jgi:hypothetical protein
MKLSSDHGYHPVFLLHCKLSCLSLHHMLTLNYVIISVSHCSYDKEIQFWKKDKENLLNCRDTNGRKGLNRIGVFTNQLCAGSV